MSSVKNMFLNNNLELNDLQAEIDHLRQTKIEEIVDTIECLIRVESDSQTKVILIDVRDRLERL